MQEVGSVGQEVRGDIGLLAPEVVEDQAAILLHVPHHIRHLSSSPHKTLLFPKFAHFAQQACWAKHKVQVGPEIFLTIICVQNSKQKFIRADLLRAALG